MSALERRMCGGPFAEKEPTQRLIMLVASVTFAGMLIVPALDRRLGWSHMPVSVVPAGKMLMGLGWIAIYFVLRKNTYTSSTIEPAPNQKVISTGPYALVRHPMYPRALPMLLGIPLSLGSWQGLVPFRVMVPALIWRIFDEEKFLTSGREGTPRTNKKCGID